MAPFVLDKVSGASSPGSGMYAHMSGYVWGNRKMAASEPLATCSRFSN